MLILSRVCAEFHDLKGASLFSVTPSTRGIFVEAPDSIRQDPLFRMLISDGSLEAAVPEERKRMLENDPAANHDASGKAIRQKKQIAEAAAGQDGVPGGNDEALGTVSAAKPGKSAKSKSDKIIAAEQINEKGDRA